MTGTKAPETTPETSPWTQERIEGIKDPGLRKAIEEGLQPETIKRVKKIIAGRAGDVRVCGADEIDR
ncbi:MAG: hypothetical protein Q8P62_04765 [Candidatus Peregrinibacteria bacterium]|nr:hypothetical protein [Candidatus Peregrinibacteria bacterium]